MKESLLKARLGNEKYNAIKKTSLSQISKNIIDNFNTILDTLKLNQYTEDQMNMRKKEIKEELISKCKPKPKDEILEKLTERALNNEIEERRIARKQIKQMFIARFLLQPVKENWKASLDSPIRSLLLDGEALISTKFKKNVMGTLDTSLLTKKIPELDKISKEYFELTFDEVCDGYIPHLNALVETSRLHKEQPLQLTFDTLKEKHKKVEEEQRARETLAPQTQDKASPTDALKDQYKGKVEERRAQQKDKQQSQTKDVSKKPTRD